MKGKRLPVVLLVILIVSLPLLLLGIKQTLDNRTRAAAADKLETEGGVRAGNATVVSDTTASGGSYVALGVNQTNSPTPSPTSGANPTNRIYGPGITMDGIGNLHVGYYQGRVSLRWKSPKSTTVPSFRTYWISGAVGYGGGTGGIIQVTLQPDDGTVNHFPTGTVLATANTFSPGYAAHPNQQVVFPTNPSVVEGRIYHFVFTNIDPNPHVNWGSVNNLIRNHGPEYDTALYDDPMQPRFGESRTESEPAWRALVGYPNWERADSDSPYDNSYSQHQRFWPIMDITFGDGTHYGQSYYELVVGPLNRGWPFGGSNRARMTITPKSNVTVSQAFFRIGRESGTSDIILQLKRSDGSEIDRVTIPASMLPARPLHQLGQSSKFVGGSFRTNQTLQAGNTYYLEASSSSLNGAVWSVKKNYASSYHPSTFFNDGIGEHSSGSGWSSAGGDWQFYFTLQ